MAFEGSFQHAFDDKWRVSIPSSFREAIRQDGGDAVVLSRAVVSEAPCLNVHTVGAWDRTLKKYESEPTDDRLEAASRRIAVSMAHRLQLDKQGRITVPIGLRNWGQLTKDVFIVSCVGGFQLWDPPIWSVVDAADIATLSPNFGRFANGGA